MKNRKKVSNTKIKSILKKHIKLVIGFVIGISITTGVYGATILFDSDEVSYDNTTSGLESTNVQDALDELKIKADTCGSGGSSSNPYGNCYSPSGNTYYEYGTPTTSSTQDYTTLNKNVFVALNGDQKSVCIVRNNTLYCFPNNQWSCTKDYVQEVFSDISCDVSSPDADCDASDMGCLFYDNGNVTCSDYSDDSYCYVDSGGNVGCG